MAARYFRNTGNTSWNVTTNWSATDGGVSVGAIPTSADDVFLTANSGDLNMNAAGVCLSFNCTGYTRTLSGASALTVSGNVTLSSTMIVTYTGLLTINAAASIDSAGKTLTNVTFGLATIYTLLSDLRISGNFVSGGAGTKTINGFNMYVGGNFTTSTTVINGTTNIILNGAANPTWSGTQTISNPITINGNVTISGSINCAGNLIYSGGTVTTIGSTMNFTGTNQQINSGSINWNNITFGGSGSAILLSNLNASGILTLGGTGKIFAGTFGFVANTLSMGGGATTNYVLQTGNIYRVTNSFIATSSNPVNIVNIKSSVDGTKATLTLDSGATCSVGYVNFQDIDASGGRKINTFNGTVTNCNNVEGYVDPVMTIAKSFAA